MTHTDVMLTSFITGLLQDDWKVITFKNNLTFYI